MARHERQPRIKKRVPVRFGTSELSHGGFLRDISSNGLGIATASVFVPGTALRVQIMLPDGDVAVVEGHVTWGKRAPPGLQAMVASVGMGLSLTRADEKYFLFLQKMMDGTRTKSA